MSKNRLMAPMALLVCRVESTRWPVSEDCMAISAVSLSRISPIKMTSGSCRRMARRALLNVMPMFSCTGIWVMPGISYSTGSSTVMIFFSPSMMYCKAEYRVVVLPEPVGPVTRIIPWLFFRICWKLVMMLPDSPDLLRSRICFFWSRIRMTISSPYGVGTVLTLMSMVRPPLFVRMRPSWGRRRSEISSFASIFMRETTAGYCSPVGPE